MDYYLDCIASSFYHVGIDMPSLGTATEPNNCSSIESNECQRQHDKPLQAMVSFHIVFANPPTNRQFECGKAYILCL